MLIGIYGKSRAGKLAVVRTLKKKFRFNEINLLDPLKSSVSEIFNMTLEQLYDEKLKDQIDLRYGMSPRKILQYLGIDVFRQMYPDIWVAHFIRRYNRMKASGLRFVVSDVKFKNDKDAIEKEGGAVWKVVEHEKHGSSFESDLDHTLGVRFAATLRDKPDDSSYICRQVDNEVIKLARRSYDC